jgi:hypothetical protein
VVTLRYSEGVTFWWQPPCLLRSVIVNLKDDTNTAVRGALWSARGPWLTIRNAELLKAGAAPTPIDGEIVIHRDNVSFLQALP